MSTDFQDILQDAEQMRAQIDQENTDLPRLQRTFSQLLEAGQRKLAKTNYLTTDPNSINASILLASKGIDAPRLTQTIEHLQTTAPTIQQQQQQQQQQQHLNALQNIDNLRDTSIQNYLKLEKEIALMSTIEETRKRTLKEIENTYWEQNEIEWEKQKQKIMNALHGSNTDILNIVKESPSLGCGPQQTSMQGRSLMNDIQMAFAKEVYLYNEKALISTQQKPDLMDCFLNVARKLNDKNIEDAWTMLSYMASNVSNKTSAESTDRVAVHMQQAFVHQAIKYLEMTFKEFLKNSINSNLEQAKIGGKLGTLQLITGYLRLNPSKYYSSFEETFTDNQQPLWAIIYLCLRCGDYEAARSVASKAKKDDIAGYLGEFMQNNGCLSVGSENKLKLEYKGRIKRSQDSFKRAVYRYLSRLDIDDDLSDILDNVDDFLWFNLNSIQFNVNTTDGQQHDYVHTPTQYQEFQHKMSIDYGETYFTKSRNPYPYLQVLLLTSQFELAIEFLLKYEHMVVHALHMAIALYEKRLLNLTKPSVAQLVCSDQQDAKGIKRINFASLIKMYTRKFECTDPRDALEYYYFVRNIFNAQNKNYFALYISELALETREFELLFGKLEKNGVRKSGALDKFLPKTDDIINLVAKEIENKGLIEESIKLYDLCKQQQRVLELCNKLISQFVCDVNTANSNRDRLKQMVLAIAQRYKSDVSDPNVVGGLVLKSTSTTFYLLVDLMSFFDVYHTENWDLAYDTLNRLNTLPSTTDNIDVKIKQFIAFTEEIKRNFPELILAAMTTICALYQQINKVSNISFQTSSMMGNSPLVNTDGGKRVALNQLKEHARALIKFVGCIPYRLPGDTNARLLQLELMLN